MAVLELRAERLVAGGDALAREPSGRVVFVAGALPGELVQASIVAEWRDYARAVVADVVEASPSRIEPPCPLVAAGCGGCTWQHIDVEAQRELKGAVVREALARTGGQHDVDVRLGRALEPWGFRTTVRMAVLDGGLGFRAAQSHDVVPVDHCLVAHPLLADLIAGVRAPGADEVTLRCGVATGERLALATPLVELSVPDGVACGTRAAVHEVVDGTRLRVSAPSFFQTRVDGAAALVAEVRSATGALGGDTAVVDAYAGVGLFASTVARDADVVCIEQSASACADARANLQQHPSARVIQSAVERWVPRRADVVIADPSRRGLGARAVDVVAATGAPRVVLVSCDAVALARDARLLVNSGYGLQTVTLVDLFPHTPHVETVSVFERG